MDYDKYSFVLASPNRQKIILALDKEKIPSQLSKELKMQDANVARALRELVGVGIIKCVNPESKRGRIYILSNVGIVIRKKLSL
jgi:predicted transcriptional regulator